MPSNPVQTLSRKGAITGVGEKIDRLFAYYQTSNKSQSYLYKGKIRSLQGTVQTYNTSSADLTTYIGQDLSALYGSAFDAVDVTVTVTDTSPDGTFRWNIAIDVVVTEAGQQYSIGQVFQTINGIVQPLIKTLNG